MTCFVRLRRGIARFVRVPRAHKLLALRVLGLLVCTDAALRCLRLERTARLLGVPIRTDGAPTAWIGDGTSIELDPREVARVRMVRRVGSFLYGRDRGCLRTSLVLAAMLRPRRTAVRLGIRRQGGTASAHAWVEVDDVALDRDRGFHALTVSQGGT